MRKPRTFARAAVAAGAVLVLAACGGNPTAAGGGGNDKADAGSGPTKAEQLYQEVTALSGKERRDKLVQLAADEDGLNLYTSMNADMVDAVTEAFSDEFDIDVNVYRANSETVLQRVLQEQDAGFPGNDLVETNATEMMALQKEGVLAPCISQEIIDQVPEAGRYDDWTATRFNIFAPSWNTDMITDPPKTWEDLADPKYDGKMALELGDYDWYMTLSDFWLEQGKSQDEVDKLWADIVDGASVVKGHTVMAELMGAGQFGLATSNYTYIVEKAQAEGSPVETEPLVQNPVVRPNGGSCMKSAENPATAMLFMDWLMQEGQKVLAESEATPAVGDGLEGVDLVAVDGQKLLDEGEEWSKKYDDLLAGVKQIGD